MNVWMWEHPATRANLQTLRQRGVEVIDPVAGELACGDEGIGRMAEPETIVAAIFDRLKKKVRAPRGRLKGVPSKAAASS
jgi:phosphopantothenoylcysteine decarboxylase/phosphopantothenate--cysteine ligase